MESNDTSQLIFASVTTIPAKDAEPLQVDFNTMSCCYYFFCAFNISVNCMPSSNVPTQS